MLAVPKDIQLKSLFRRSACALAVISLGACVTESAPVEGAISDIVELVAPQTAEVSVSLTGAQLEFADDLSARMLLDGMAQPSFAPAFSIQTEQGGTIDSFEIVSSDEARSETPFGPATATTISATSAEGVSASLVISVPDAYPATALVTATYTNTTDELFGLQSWRNNAFSLSSEDGFWAFMGSSHEHRPDWAQELGDDFYSDNFMGMNASDYGGGTPVADIWSRDGGLAVGHVDLTPRLTSLPVSASGDYASVAVTEEAFEALEPGASFTTPTSFVTVHTGDFFAPLTTYRKMMSDQGLSAPDFPDTSYEAIWCAWGYERNFEMDDILATLPKAKELGLEWAVLDDGWQTAEGDWYLSPEKYPNGDADMIAFVDEIKEAGLKPKLWVAPLATDPGTDLMHDQTDMLLLNEWGQPQLVTWWNSFYLCPAYEPTVENGKALVRKIMGEWGYRGLKLDGQHLNGVAPCYNPAHNHERPEESIEGLQDYWRELYETAMEIDPQAVIELCPCGTSYAFHNMPYFNQAVSSDPTPAGTPGASIQVRQKGKTIKALMGPQAAYAGDHVELSDNGDDFASTVGIGAVVSTKFTWPNDTGLDNGTTLTPEREAEWSKWISVYLDKMLSTGTYRGELYDIGFDAPETHAVEKDGMLHYSFYAETFDGTVELRGLAPGRYRIVDYVNNVELGEIDAADPTLAVSFEHALLIEAKALSN